MKTPAWRLALVVILAAAAAGSILLVWPEAEVRLRPDDAGMVAQGRQVYAGHCAQCHGSRLEGQPDWRSRLPNGRLPAPPHDASGHTWHHPDPVLFALTKHGLADIAPPGYETDMPAFAGVLSDTEIIAVLSYIKSTWPDDIRRRHDALNRQTGG